jgi:hypothetical protein
MTATTTTATVKPIRMTRVAWPAKKTPIAMTPTFVPTMLVILPLVARTPPMHSLAMTPIPAP